jgi:hypothetical protein
MKTVVEKIPFYTNTPPHVPSGGGYQNRRGGRLAEMSHNCTLCDIDGRIRDPRRADQGDYRAEFVSHNLPGTEGVRQKWSTDRPGGGGGIPRDKIFEQFQNRQTT